MAKKLCPMLKTNGSDLTFLECQEGKCAWWCEYNQSCAIPTIADVLADSSINEIVWGPVKSERSENDE